MIADTNYLYLSSWYLDDINANYTKPLDWNYYTSLKTPLAQRLYELLGVKFYGVIQRGGSKLSYRYSTLCDLLPATRQKYLSWAKRILEPAHTKLKETGFLADWDWHDTSPKTTGDWLIIYWPGPRARDEIKDAKTYFKAPQLEVEYLPAPEAEAATTKPMPEPQAETASPMAQELLQRGITKAVAIDLAAYFPDEHLQEKIDLHDYKKETGELTTNAAGWLREAIARDYQLSDEQQKQKAQVEQQQAQQQEQKTLAAKATALQEQRLKEAVAAFPAAEQWVKERVMEHIKVRETTIKALGGEPFSAAEMAQMYFNYQAQIPQTEDEKRAWLMSHDRQYSLSEIISELKKEPQPSRQPATETAEERYPFNSIEAVLGEIARQQADFEASTKRIDNES